MNKAYFAGLIDGEGCITIKRNPMRNKGKSPVYTLALTIEMCDPRPIKAFCDFYQMEVRMNGTRNLKNPTKHRFLFVAWCSAKKSVAILRDLLPYLLAKREEAEKAIEFYHKCYETQNHRAVGRAKKPVPEELTMQRHNYYLLLQELKRRKFSLQDL
jgi:hypothetical protein